MKDLTGPLKGNLPEIVWNQLKLVASEAAQSPSDLLLEDCIARVEAVVLNVIGRADALPGAVVAFYARELSERISSLRKSSDEAAS